jgi:hypothetical protein
LLGFAYAAVGAVTRRAVAACAVTTDFPVTIKVIAGHTVDRALPHWIDQLRQPARHIRLELSGDRRDGRRS